MIYSNKTLLLTPFLCAGIAQTQGMILSLSKDKVLSLLEDAAIRDEIALVRDYYEKEFPAQFDRGGYPSRPAFNLPSGRIVEALNGGAIFFIDRSMSELRPQDIRDDPVFFDMRKVGSVVISDFVTTVAMPLLGSDLAPFDLRMKRSVPLASGPFGNLIPADRTIDTQPQEPNKGEPDEFSL